MSKRIRKLDIPAEKPDRHPLNVVYGPEIDASIRFTECAVAGNQFARIQEVLDKAAVEINEIMGW